MRSKKRVIAAVMAVLLAVLGIGALVVYTKGARDRAFSGTQTVSALRVIEDVPAGTKASDLASRVESVKLPRAAVPGDAVKSLAALGNKTTTASLVPGEILVTARFSGTAALNASGALDVPKGLQEVTVQIDSSRALGGAVQPGDRVGVVASFEPPKTSGYNTNFAVNHVLVIAVNGGSSAASDAATAATGLVLVRLALDSDSVEKVVNAAEFGKIWLSRQGHGATTGRTLITPENVVKGGSAAASEPPAKQGAP